jgi:hypothetical protein
MEQENKSEFTASPLGETKKDASAPKPSVIERPDLARKYSRMAFIERNFIWVKRGFYVLIGIVFFVVAFFIGSAIIKAVLPKPQVIVPLDLSKIPPSDFHEITLDEPQLVSVGERAYDVYFHITDANKQWGVNNLSYRVNLLNTSGTLLKSQVGSYYVLPATTSLVIVSNVATPEVATKATVEFLSGEFAQPVTTEALSLEVRQRQFSPNTTEGRAVFSGVLRNSSNYDLDRVTVQMLVKNAAGTVIATNFTEANTLKSNEDRGVRLNFDRGFDDSVTYDITVSTNALQRSNFLLKQGKPVQF